MNISGFYRFLTENCQKNHIIFSTDSAFIKKNWLNSSEFWVLMQEIA
jgi:hypothetical protein